MHFFGHFFFHCFSHFPYFYTLAFCLSFSPITSSWFACSVHAYMIVCLLIAYMLVIYLCHLFIVCCLHVPLMLPTYYMHTSHVRHLLASPIHLHVACSNTHQTCSLFVTCLFVHCFLLLPPYLYVQVLKQKTKKPTIVQADFHWGNFFLNGNYCVLLYFIFRKEKKNHNFFSFLFYNNL